MTDSTETFAVEYACDLACRIELDLSLADTHLRFTRGQMRREVDDLHGQIHENPDVIMRAEYTVTNLRAAAREKASTR
jgi:hypothetical protein